MIVTSKIISSTRETGEWEEESLVWRKTYFEDNIFHWISVELLLNNPGSSFFFAFGAGHFVGDHTIIDVVRRAGFTVEPVMTVDDVDNWVTNNYDTNQSGEDEE